MNVRRKASRLSIWAFTPLILFAIGYTLIPRPEGEVASKSDAIAVVNGTAKPFTVAPPVGVINASSNLSNQSANTLIDSHHTDLTDDENKQIDQIDSDVKNEPRNEAWASSAERAITAFIGDIPSANIKNSTVTCGSESCFVTIRIPPAAADQGSQTSLETLQLAQIGDGTSGLLTTSKTFTQRQEDGAFIARVLMTRSVNRS